MRFLSLFSGIEAASVACESLGWVPVAFAEVAAFPCRLLAHRWPHVPNLGDVARITAQQIAALGRIDVVIGGSPCQDLSIAGKRAGLSGARSSLFHEQLRIFHATRSFCGARWLWWENVPGAFSTNGGRDFAAVVGEMAGCRVDVPAGGWGNEGLALGAHGLLEWSVLDAQWFGVAQRRRRVFAVLDTGTWSDRPPVLLEPESVRGDSPPSRAAREDVAGNLAARASGGGGLGTDFDLSGGLIPETVGALTDGANQGGGRNGQDAYTGRIIPVAAFGGNNQNGPIEVATACRAKGGSGHIDFESETFVVHGTQDPLTQVDQAFPLGRNGGQENVVAFAARGSNVSVEDDIAATLLSNSDRATGGATMVAFAENSRGELRLEGGDGQRIGALSTGGGKPGQGHPVIAGPRLVRRLTPLECERLQGFPDHHTAIPGAKDGPRYAAIGNSMAVPVIRWIARRIQRAHEWGRA